MEEYFQQGTNGGSTDCQSRLLSDHSGLLTPLNRTAKKGITPLAGVDMQPPRGNVVVAIQWGKGGFSGAQGTLWAVP